MAKLKVYRTAIGFHDAYVAAPSMKAALRAWGSDKDLFARGAAELVTEPELTEESLANPGVVFKRSRGSPAEQIAALDKGKPRRKPSTPPSASIKPAKRMTQQRLMPDRSALNAAETALSDARARHEHARADFDAELVALRRARRKLATQENHEVSELEKKISEEDASYRRKLEKWTE